MRSQQPLLWALMLVSRLLNTHALLFDLLLRRDSLKRSARRHSKTLANENEEWLRMKRANREFVAMAVPSFLQQATVMPLVDLVDAAFLSRLGPQALGGMGVARASHTAVSKLYNSPLSKSSISLVASKCSSAGDNNATQEAKDDLAASVTSAMLLGVTVGMVQLLVFRVLAKPILGIMGIGSLSDMAPTALFFLKARANSAPSATLWLVMTGAFRGLGDSWTPLLCALFLNLLNLCLDPFFIINLGLGAVGAAHATTISQTTALIPMLWILHRRVPIRLFSFSKDQWNKLVESLKQYIKAGIYLFGRSVAKLAAFTYCSRRSTRLGPVGASAYSVTFQIGFWITLMCESVAIATQTLVSRERSDRSSLHSPPMRQSLVWRLAILWGMLVTGTASTGTWFFRHQILSTLTKNKEIQATALAALPACLLTQVVKGVTFPVNGMMLGKMDWGLSFWSMWMACLACFATLQWRSAAAATAGLAVGDIWMAWTAFQATQAACGLGWYTTNRNITKDWRKEVDRG